MSTTTKAAEWIEDQTLKLVGTGTPGEQIAAAIVLAVIIIASSSVTLGWTLVLVPVAILFAGIGILRLVPWIDRRWPL